MSNEVIVRGTDDPVELSPQDYIAILQRRRSIIIYVAATISLLGLIYACIAPKSYVATAKILIDPPSMTVSEDDSNDPMSSMFNMDQQQTVDTQVQELQTEPILNSTAAIAGYTKLGVTEVPGTNIISVTSASSNPERAAHAANTLVRLYLSENLHADQADLLSAQTFATDQLRRDKQQMISASAALIKFRSTHNITDLDKEQENIQTEFGDLRGKLLEATQNSTSDQAQIASIRAQIADTPPIVESRLVQSNGNISTLSNQLEQDEIERQRLTQPGGFTGQAPQIIALDGEIKAIKHSLAHDPKVTTSITSEHNGLSDELEQQLSAAETDKRASDAKIANIKQEISGLKAVLQQFLALETPYEALEREYDHASDEETTFYQKLDDIALRLRARHTPIHVIEPATVPVAPVYPNRPLIAIFGILMGGFFGLLAALGMEMFDDRLNSSADVERALSLPALGRIPEFTSDDIQMLAKMTSRRPELESYKSLRTNLYFCSVDLPVKSLLVTSAAPQEGKTTTSVHLAFAIAADNKEVILIDTDLRRPSIHKVLGIPSCPGLTDLLLGHATLDEVMLHVPGVPGLKVVTAGTLPPNPSELLNSQKFQMLMDDLTRRFDMVLCDGAPVLAVSDSQIVSHRVDATILVVANGQTKKPAVVHARNLLLRARANLVGIVYNKASNSEHGYYDYHYSSLPEQLEDATPERVRALMTTEIPPK